MRNKNNKSFICILTLIIFVVTILSPMNLVAAGNEDEINEDYGNYIENDDTGYYAWVDDQACLFTIDESMDILYSLYDITEYGNAIVITIDDNYTTTERFADQMLADPSVSGPNVSATLFIIDMDNRNIYIRNDGSIEKVITSGRAETITDNVYKYATDGDYYSCTSIAINQILTLLEGGRIAQPMKYISNILLAFLAALLINYFVVLATSSVKKPTNTSVIQAAKSKLDIGKATSVHTGTTKRYDPPSSSSSGGGGGGSSSSGGGHSF